MIRQVEPRIERVLGTIRQLAPNATVVLVGYPHVVSTSLFRDAACHYEQNVATWMADMTDLAVEQMQTAASAVGNVRFADVRAAFEHHEACTPDDVEWINAVLADSASGSGTNHPGSGSFHPNLLGHAADERVIIGVAG